MGHTHHHRRHDRVHEESGAMGSEGRVLRVRTTLESGLVADHLMTLARALREGGGTLCSGGQTVILRTGEMVDLEVQAGEEGAQSVVRLALRWRTPVPPADLEITSGVRAPAAWPVDLTAQAHEVGLVLPGDPPSIPGAPSHAPVSTAPPVSRRVRRGERALGNDSQRHE